MRELTRVASTTDIAPGQAIAVDAQGQRIAVFNVNGAFHAISDTCTHRGGPLSQGKVEGATVTCPWHGAKFDILTGNVLSPPAPTGVAAYKVVVEGGEIKLEL
ncbi:MAG: non-heme iron oxygenase ferredoxin subunit [Acidobacteria bacterium]|nr:MAG: non-heme iron oxygenase ferredoxin subunit [Acidobacteriota bacterium]